MPWEIAIPITIAVTGWVITHISTIRAQDRQLRNEILNQARLDITEAIRAYQSWLSKVGAVLRTTPATISMRKKAGLDPGLANHFDEWSKLFGSDAGVAWLLRLEDYEILFPETATVRDQLAERDRAFKRGLSNFTTRAAEVMIGKEEAEAGLRRLCDELVEQQADLTALAEDLRIHLQNVTLSEITGNSIPERRPMNPSVPVIVRDPDGNLRIAPAGDKGRLP